MEDFVSHMMTEPVPAGPVVLSPAMTVRPASTDELTRMAPWAQVNGLLDQPLDVVVYADGSGCHAPEVIAAYHDAASGLPANFTLIYLHRGFQIDSVHPLLASLLHLTGHSGKSHALRQHGSTDTTTKDRFVRAAVPPGAAALVIDDHQHRIGAHGSLHPAQIVLTPIPTLDVPGTKPTGDPS